MDMLNKALIIASKAHKGQLDKGGVDYILHPVYVALRLDNDDEKITALLHDTIEDTDLTIDDIIGYGFKKEIVEAISLLTRDKGMDYFDYIKRLKPNKLAVKVKLADLRHNSDKERIKLLGERGLVLEERYKKAIEFLQS